MLGVLRGVKFRSIVAALALLVWPLLAPSTAIAQTATLSTPANGAIAYSNAATTFSWGAVGGAAAYYLYVGTTNGANDVVNSGEISSTSLVNSSLPLGTLYVTLYTKSASSTWTHSSSSFTVVAAPQATLTAPANGATVYSNATTIFSWGAASGATAYYLYVGTTAGTNDVVNSGEITATSLARSPLPVGTLYVTLYTKSVAGWTHTVSSLTVIAPPQATLASPINGATVYSNSTTTFSWSAASGATAYYLYVGTTAGANDVVNSGEITVTSLARSPLPVATLYVTLYTKSAAGWTHSNSGFTVVAPPQATLVAPANGATIYGPVTFSWGAVGGALTYYLYVGTTVGASNIVNSGEITATSLASPSLPLGTLYVTLYTKSAAGWTHSNSSFTVAAVPKATLAAPSNGGTVNTTSVTFSWAGVNGALVYYLYVGTTVGAKDVVDSQETTATSLGASSLPVATLYVRLWTKSTAGWVYSDSTFVINTSAPSWSDADIGAVGAVGSYSLNAGSFTVNGSGADIWNAADAFHFVYTPLNGDGTITARVVSQTNTNVWAKSGVMVRESLNANSSYAAVEVTPGNGAVLQARTSTGSAAVGIYGPATITAPYWVRLVRIGNSLTGYVAPDGVTWTKLGQYAITMAQQLYIGLAVSSHSAGVIGTAVFDNVATAPAVVVSVAPATALVALGRSQQFSSTVSNASNTAVSWQVNGVPGGSATTGTIDATGLYSAPPTQSTTPTSYTVSAASVQDATASGTAQATVDFPDSVLIAPHQAALTLTQTQQFTATVLGGGSVNWGVDGVAGGDSTVGTISPSGVYAPPITAGVHTITATNATNSAYSASAAVAVTDLAGVYTYHNDVARTGQNLQEYALTPSTVSGGRFGRRWSCGVDGEAYAQPLYVANLAIGGGTHNVLIVATMHNSVYAFDADDPGCRTYWQVSFLGTGVTSVPPGYTGCVDITSEIGITGTPVIDAASRIVYLVAKTLEGSSYLQRLHALDVRTGAEATGSPVTIQASVPANGGVTVVFTPQWHNQRPGLVLAGGGVYIAWSAHCDVNSWHGWLMRYDATTMAQTAVYNATPNGVGGGIWMSGAAPAVDSSGSLYFSTGNGTFENPVAIVPPFAPGNDFGESFLKLDPTTLAVQDFYTPSQESAWSVADLDISSAGVTVLPNGAGPAAHPNVLVGADKQGHLWMLDRAQMSHYSSTSDNVVQFLTLPNTSGCAPGYCVMAAPAYWNGTVYIAVNSGPLMALPLAAGLLPPGTATGTAVAASRSATNFNYPSPTPVISASSATNGIAWVLDNNANGTDNGSMPKGPAVLRAYDATNLATMLFSSSTLAADAIAGTAVKFTLPVVANGHVYVAGGQALTVYGLAP